MKDEHVTQEQQSRGVLAQRVKVSQITDNHQNR